MVFGVFKHTNYSAYLPSMPCCTPSSPKTNYDLPAESIITVSAQIHEISSVRQALADLDEAYKRQRAEWDGEVGRLRSELSSALNNAGGGGGGGPSGPHPADIVDREQRERYGGPRDSYGGAGGPGGPGPGPGPGGRRGPMDGDVEMHDRERDIMRDRERERDRESQRERERGDRERDMRRKDKIPKSERTYTYAGS